MSLINKEDEAVTNFRKYLQIPTVHPNVDYSEFYLKLKIIKISYTTRYIRYY